MIVFNELKVGDRFYDPRYGKENSVVEKISGAYAREIKRDHRGLRDWLPMGTTDMVKKV